MKPHEAYGGDEIPLEALNKFIANGNRIPDEGL